MKVHGKLTIFPDGRYDVCTCSRAIFEDPADPDHRGSAGKGSDPQCQSLTTGSAGMRITKRDQYADHLRATLGDDGSAAAAAYLERCAVDDVERARLRARSAVRRLALCNEFRWFVTLTINPDLMDSHDPEIVVKRLSQWCSNQVKRRGLRYILVPERHKKGGIHFHGFFTDCMEAVDSGHVDKKGHKVYNLPGWSYGFTTAVELYGDYHAAVGYVCKYIGKDAEKIGGRWYYSGGKLEKPVEKCVDLTYEAMVDLYGVDNIWTRATPAGIMNGITCGGMKGERL